MQLTIEFFTVNDQQSQTKCRMQGIAHSKNKIFLSGAKIITELHCLTSEWHCLKSESEHLQKELVSGVWCLPVPISKISQ